MIKLSYIPAICIMLTASTAVGKAPKGGSVLTWQVMPGVRVPGVESSSTIRMPNGALRTYCTGIVTSTSIDGLKWTAPTPVTLEDGAGAKGRSPSVLPLTGLKYLMVFEVSGSGESGIQGAISSDGVTFERIPGKHGGALVAGNASSPDLVRVGVSKVRMYYVSGGRIQSAMSEDSGKNWQQEGSVRLSNLPAGLSTGDPDVVRTAGGQFLMLMSSASGPSSQIFSAISFDGRTFAFQAGDLIAGSNPRAPDVVSIASNKYLLLFTDTSPAGGTILRSALTKK